jgi:hypothetical protein
VADSLVAAGDNEEVVRRVAGLLKGEAAVPGGMAAFMGGGGAAGVAGAHQRPWVDRPGEGTVGGGFAAGGGGGFGGAGGAAELQRIAAAFRVAGVPGLPGVRIGGGFGGGAGGAPFADPGSYTVHVTIGDRTLSSPLQVVRDPAAQ